ncbi:CYTH and CHAD domain-containing protein [Rhodococcus sp. G-MC3]|uniref:CYTH and CHAD domain-containing protein n=1 Tax=Rhodococcus sp. G-MC3 TaxID=3046209 RepID=UPI0024B9C01D|nr:CYTH and CHAD domain-containing protein [Rhodococcus sp. G-MC3]MDJ0395608.1 CYTH and CHAD domain-containing protein [Rhodococcus sp. G-MC3]
MDSIQTEREDKFDVDAGFVLPPLEQVTSEGGSAQTSEVQLISSYYDTDDLDLLRRGITVRRRRGDADTGWHAKVPAEKARTEIRLPLGQGDDESVPDELASLLRGASLGKPLSQVATLVSLRTVHVLTDSDGGVVAELADDSVSVDLAGTDGHAWRELEVELGPSGSEGDLKRVGKVLKAAGATRGVHPSKLHRALRSDEVPAHTGALGTVADYLQQQSQAVFAGDVYLRRGLDSIHSTRVAIRRYRSALRVFADLFDEARATGLDAELSWYASILGEVRDRQVQRARFAEVVHELPDHLVLGPVAARIENDLLAEQIRFRAVVAAELDGDRYRALLAEMAAWSRELPASEGATKIGEDDLDRMARKAGKKAGKRVAAAIDGGNDEALHRARKAAKRARYAAELVKPIVGKKEAKLRIARYKGIQEILGEHQDSVVAAHTLLLLGMKAGIAGAENGFTFGLMYAREMQASVAARDEISRYTL